MASTTLSISSSTSFLDARARPSPLSSPNQCVSFQTLPSPHLPSLIRNFSKPSAFCRKPARNVVSMATGDAPASSEIDSTELPEIVKTVQEAWDKVDDKYAVSSLIVAGVIALWGSTGVISAIDRLPVVPGVLELVGIGYTGWFAYKNLVFQPDRDALLSKIKATYTDIIGSS